MESKNSNPYNKGFVITYAEGDRSLQRNKIKYLPTQSDISHTVVEGNNLPNLAFKYYGNSKEWWAIADANDIGDQLINPFDLPVGLKLIIPDLAKFKNALK